VKITTINVEQTEVHSDASEGYKFRCPECDTEITIAKHMWWGRKCSCGYSWHVDVIAVGEK
jgi:hypothetical protein